METQRTFCCKLITLGLILPEPLNTKGNCDVGFHHLTSPTIQSRFGCYKTSTFFPNLKEYFRKHLSDWNDEVAGLQNLFEDEGQLVNCSKGNCCQAWHSQEYVGHVIDVFQYHRSLYNKKSSQSGTAPKCEFFYTWQL